jgi:tRNA pseudouridine55 synthase
MTAIPFQPNLQEYSSPSVWEGIWVVDKPGGITSNKVLQILRKTTRLQRIGYLGTLDPIATGVLPICIGWATKIIPFLPNHPKGYRAEMILGQKTDTQDRSGHVMETASCALPGRSQVQEVLQEFIGSQEQVPPSFSALKYKGKPLYQWARRGIPIVKPPRQITIDSLRFLEMNGERVTFELFCSPGTYVRTLCHDIGERLGCGAYLNQLQRIQSGPFTLEQACPLEKIQRVTGVKEIEALKIPLEKILENFPHIQMDWKWKEVIKQGGSLAADWGDAPWPAIEPGKPIFLTGPRGELWAVYQKVGHPKQVFKPIRVII